MKEIPGLSYDEVNGSPTIDSENSLYMIPFWKNEEYFSNIDSRSKFITSVKQKVRSSERYSAYKKYLIEKIGLDHCAVHKNITSLDVELEMHHGPIFILEDYINIVINYFLIKKWKITTLIIASQVLKEHEDNMIQVVMLSPTAHEEVEARNVFIHPNQAWGRLDLFIKKYKDAIGLDLREKYNRYIDRCMMSESDDYGLFKLNSQLWEKKETTTGWDEI